ncbi:MAG TPA: hypothetical protein VJS46_10050 [Rhizorhapis sp.]|nr:hypothetical protein [Rhizorhapis sp.]HKR17702.1 hypothetical protein [Rhizorhapis sp.]
MRDILKDDADAIARLHMVFLEPNAERIAQAVKFVKRQAGVEITECLAVGRPVHVRLEGIQYVTSRLALV